MKGEFGSCIIRLFSSVFEEKVKLIFDLYDFDSDGKITKEDIITLLSHVPPEEVAEVSNITMQNKGKNK